jgi:hypothetical protein
VEQHQVFRRNPNAHLHTRLMIDMAGEDRLQLRAGRQLQAIQGRCAKERLANDPRLQRAVRGIDDIVRTQQHIHCTTDWQSVGTVAAQLAHSVCTDSGLLSWPRMK